MTQADVRSIVLTELVNVQAALHRDWPPLCGESRPIGDLEMFDSQVSEDMTATILAALGAPPETKNPFTMRTDGHYLTLDEVIDFFCGAAGISEA